MEQAKFVVGVLSSGMQAQLALTVANTAKLFMEQTQILQTEQQAYAAAAQAASEAVEYAQYEAAQVTAKQATESFVGGGVGLAEPAGVMGYQGLRGTGTAEMDQEDLLIQQSRDKLNGKSEIISGPQAKELSGDEFDKRIEELNSKPVLKYNEDDQEVLSHLKARNNSKESEIDPKARKTAYETQQDKLQKAEDEQHNKRRQYHDKTERVSYHIRNIAQSAQGFARGGAQLTTAEAQKSQASADAIRQMASFAQDNQKSGADTAQQAYGNTTQVYNEQIRLMQSLAQANAAA